MKTSVGSWLPRPSIIGAVRGHVLGAVTSVRSVVARAPTAPPVSTVCRVGTGGQSRGAAHGALQGLSSAPRVERRDDQPPHYGTAYN